MLTAWEEGEERERSLKNMAYKVQVLLQMNFFLRYEKQKLPCSNFDDLPEEFLSSYFTYFAGYQVRNGNTVVCGQP